MEKLELIKIKQSENISSQGIISNRNNEKISETINYLLDENNQNKRTNIRIHSKDQYNEVEQDGYRVQKSFKNNNTYTLIVSYEDNLVDMFLKNIMVINDNGYENKDVVIHRKKEKVTIDITTLESDIKFNLIII